jgi:HTH-type transcriptional regulator/antitoxin HipB
MEMTTVQALAAAVRGRRRALRMTQEAVAKRAGVSRSYVGHLESGKATVELRSVLSVLDALGLILELKSRDEIEGAQGSELDRLLSDYELRSE